MSKGIIDKYDHIRIKHFCLTTTTTKLNNKLANHEPIKKKTNKSIEKYIKNTNSVLHGKENSNGF